jgi:hypothetical protein
MRKKIQEIFEQVWREQKGTEPPRLDDDTLLLDTGLDSLGFAIIVTRMEEELGYDPFSLAEDAYYPQTFLQFVQFYETNRPR